VLKVGVFVDQSVNETLAVMRSGGSCGGR